MGKVFAVVEIEQSSDSAEGEGEEENNDVHDYSDITDVRLLGMLAQTF